VNHYLLVQSHGPLGISPLSISSFASTRRYQLFVRYRGPIFCCRVAVCVYASHMRIWPDSILMWILLLQTFPTVRPVVSPENISEMLYPSPQHLIDSYFSYTFLEAVHSCRHLRRFSRLFEVTFDPPPLSFHFAGISCPLKPSQVAIRSRRSSPGIPFLAYSRRQEVSITRVEWHQCYGRAARPQTVPGDKPLLEEAPLNQPDPYEVAMPVASAQSQRDTSEGGSRSSKGLLYSPLPLPLSASTMHDNVSFCRPTS